MKDSPETSAGLPRLTRPTPPVCAGDQPLQNAPAPKIRTKTLTTRELAEIYGKQPRTILRWVKEEHFPEPLNEHARPRRWPIAAILEHMRSVGMDPEVA